MTIPTTTTHPSAPQTMRRNDQDIETFHQEFSDKVWWNRHQVRLQRIERGQHLLSAAEQQMLADAQREAQRIEAKYGRENLGWSDFEWGLLNGRKSALAWVMGDEWDESLDT